MITPRALVPLLLTVAASLQAQTPNLAFLTNEVDGRALPEMLGNYLREQVKLHRRATPAPTAEFRSRLIQQLGGFPPRTPLNPRLTGTLVRDGYRIEKIIFESQPGFFVTANLYLPASGAAPYPAILFPLGHENGSKANPVWQQILGTFARRGYVALTWDQLGQGERVQHWDPALASSRATPATTEHTILGIQALLTGDALARYTIWDGMRALDYLASRPEVDPARIGVTGNSGGGTLTAYLAALDDRLRVAAPSCYITSWRRLLETIGPQDAEQCVPGFLGDGFEHLDFVRAFAPKPYLMLSAIRDFFSIDGARSTYALAREYYTPGSVSMVEADEGHGYTSRLRLASYAWFDRWLHNRTAPEGEDPVVPASEEELACTQTGQVATSLNGETVYTLNRTRARALKTPATLDRAAFRRLIDWREETTPPAVKPYGSERSGELLIEKLVYESEPGILVPAVLVSRPSPELRPAVLFAPAAGKAAAWKEIEALASQGAVVLAIDVRGVGETRTAQSRTISDWQYRFGDYESAMTSLLLGRSLVSQRAHDIQRGFHLLRSRPGVDPRRIYGAAQGNSAVAMLHAAAAGVPFTRLLADRMLTSYRSVSEAPLHRGIFEAVVSGALGHYDLPLLVSALGISVSIVDAVSPLSSLISLTEARTELQSAANAQVIIRTVEEPTAAVYRKWLPN